MMMSALPVYMDPSLAFLKKGLTNIMVELPRQQQTLDDVLFCYTIT